MEKTRKAQKKRRKERTMGKSKRIRKERQIKNGKDEETMNNQEETRSMDAAKQMLVIGMIEQLTIQADGIGKNRKGKGQ